MLSAATCTLLLFLKSDQMINKNYNWLIGVEHLTSTHLGISWQPIFVDGRNQSVARELSLR